MLPSWWTLANRERKQAMKQENAKQGTTGGVKPVGPSKEMADALEAQGLKIAWPEYIYVPIKGTFTTKTRPTEEKSVVIDLHYYDKEGFATAADVDEAVAQCLYEVYMEFDWQYEADGVIDEMRHNPDFSLDGLVCILEDKQEQQRLLYRFSLAARMIVAAQLLPPGEREEKIDQAFYFPAEMEGGIETYLEKVCPTLEPGTGAWNSIVVPLARDLGIGEDSSVNVE